MSVDASKGQTIDGSVGATESLVFRHYAHASIRDSGYITARRLVVQVGRYLACLVGKANLEQETVWS